MWHLFLNHDILTNNDALCYPLVRRNVNRIVLGNPKSSLGRKTAVCYSQISCLLASYIWIRYLVLIYMPRLYCFNCTSSAKLYKLSSINMTILVFKYFYQNNMFMLGKGNNLTTITYLCTITTAGTVGSILLQQKDKKISSFTKILIPCHKLCVDHFWCLTFPHL